MQKSKKPKDKKGHPINLTTETPTSRTGGGPVESSGSRPGGGPMKENKNTRAAGGKKQQDDEDMEDSMGSGKRQDDL